MTDLLFDRILVVDWSAANSPKTGADSIWIADSKARSTNPATRSEAMRQIEAVLRASLSSQQRVLIGFDFAFGYPAGFASALGLGDWSGLWGWIHREISDDDRNRSNRFEVAAKLNRASGSASGPFWGHVGKTCPDGLSPKRYTNGAPHDWPYSDFDYLREAERRRPSASPVFKLAYTGSVGSQALLGIARLEGLRRTFETQVAIWPFETGFSEDLSAPIICAEIYPSGHKVPDGPAVKDQRQVEAVLRDFRAWNQAGTLRDALSAANLEGETRRRVLRDEGWIVGL